MEDQEKLHEQWRRQYLAREQVRRRAANSPLARIRNLFRAKEGLSKDLGNLLAARRSERIQMRDQFDDVDAFNVAFAEYVSREGSTFGQEYDQDEQDTGEESSGDKRLKFCRYCGTKIPSDSWFCEECGSKLNAEDQLEVRASPEMSNPNLCEHSERESIGFMSNTQIELFKCAKCGALFTVDIHDDVEAFNSAFATFGSDDPDHD